MKRSSTLMCAVVLLMQSHGAYCVLWKKIPGINDAIACNIINNEVRYVHPDADDKPLPRGLYYLQNKSGNQTVATPMGNNLNPVFQITNDNVSNAPYVYSRTVLSKNPASGGYVYWQGAQGTDYVPTRFIDPSPALASWREQSNQALAAAASSGSSSSARIPQRQGQPQFAQQGGMLNRDQLFDNIMGISEDVFKQRCGVQPGVNQKPAIERARVAIGQQQRIYPRAQAITKGEWSQPTLDALRDNRAVQAVLQGMRNHKEGTGQIALLVYDPNNPGATDIRALHEKYPGAYFQIASNFNALEGGMGDYRKNLSDMNETPVQGEEAVMATMPAAIYRRYLLDPINLLQNLGNLFNLGRNRYGSPIIESERTGRNGEKQTLNAQNMGGMTVGVHRDIVVSSGYNDDGKMVRRKPNDPKDQKLKPAYNEELPVSGPNAITVSHIYVAAHDLKHYLNTPRYAEHAAIAKMILKADYEATILAATAYGAKELVLTMVGSSAFRNDPAWIIEALRGMLYFLAASNLNIYVVVRAADQQAQKSFENDMIEIINTIDTIRAVWNS